MMALLSNVWADVLELSSDPSESYGQEVILIQFHEWQHSGQRESMKGLKNICSRVWMRGDVQEYGVTLSIRSNNSDKGAVTHSVMHRGWEYPCAMNDECDQKTWQRNV